MKLNHKGNDMSVKSRAGKAAWAAPSATYQDELKSRIQADAEKQMAAWTAQGRIPFWPRFTARLTRRPLRLPNEREPQ